MPRPYIAVLAVALLVAAATEAAGQQRNQQRGRAPAQEEQTPAPGEIKLIYEREVFQYPVGSRRDPFTPLVDAAAQGPRFEELTLLGVIYSNRPEQSVAVLADVGGKRYRVRRGDVVGNARVLDIGPLRVVFSVDNFGVVRQEMLELKARQREGAEG